MKLKVLLEPDEDANVKLIYCLFMGDQNDRLVKAAEDMFLTQGQFRLNAIRSFYKLHAAVVSWSLTP